MTWFTRYQGFDPSPNVSSLSPYRSVFYKATSGGCAPRISASSTASISTTSSPLTRRPSRSESDKYAGPQRRQRVMVAVIGGDMAMDQYHSIPINSILRRMNIHNYQLFWCELQGYKVLTGPIPIWWCLWWFFMMCYKSYGMPVRTYIHLFFSSNVSM